PLCTPGPRPRSGMEAAAGAHQRAIQRRFILRGNLRGERQESRGPGGTPHPRIIAATDLEITERQGAPAFEPVLSKVLEPAEGNIFIDPLILYDLDGDGLSEIILGCKNLVLWNRGHGQFQRSVLCKQLREVINTCMIADFDGDGLPDFLAA